MQKLDNFRKKNDGAISNGMKKILPYIFFIAICVNIFTPFSAIQSTPLIAEAALDTSLAGYQNAFSKTKSSVTLNQSAVTSSGGVIADFHVVLDTGLALGAKTEDIYNHVEAQGRNFVLGDTGTNLYSTNAFVLVIKDTLTGQVGFVDVTPRLMIDGSGKSLIEKRPNGPVRSETDISISTNQFPQFTPGKDYTATLYYQAVGGIGSGEGKGFGESISGLSSNKDYFAITSPTPFKTATQASGGGTGVEGSLGTGKSTVVDSQASLDPMPGCSVLGMGDENGSIVGCVAQIIYYVIFVPTSYLFALAGQFFDWTFAYSISDASYRIPFVVQGWGILRDFVNMFFIFVLLYIAFRTILGVHGAKTKDLIINVIIIGLLINFSLFTTQVIVDASNILARVFYSDDAIKLTAGPNHGALDAAGTTAGPNGEIQLSAALVDKVNPQNLILNSKKVNDFGTTGNDVATNNNDDSANTTGAGSFILITILAIAINIVGLITFLSVGLIFVARVIGLWFAIIFAPIAFFSYTVPSLANNKTFGFHHWLEELLKMAFLAPIFIFFLYLILQFLEGLNFINQGDQTGVKWVIAIVVPFIFIMVLLQQAKSIAQKFSGELGQKITGAISAAGGLAIGGAALGAAALGRQTFGAVAKYAQNDGARKGALQFKGVKDAAGKIKGWNTLNPFAYLNVAQKAVGGVGKAAMAGVGTLGALGRDASGKSWFQRQTAKLGDKTHSAHVLDEYAQKITGDKTTKYSTLDEGTQKRVQDGINKDNISKAMYNKVYDKLSAVERTDINTATGGDWTVAGSMAHTMDPSLHTGEDMAKTAGESVAVSEFVNALRKGSYDVRNISQMKTSSKGLAGAFVGTSSFIADQMRNTIMKNVGVSYGKGEKDFGKDLKNAITEAIKNANIKVQVSHDSGGHDDHGGGHDDHGGGHH